MTFITNGTFRYLPNSRTSKIQPVTIFSGMVGLFACFALTATHLLAAVANKTPKDISQAHNAFGFDLFKILVEAEGNNNVFISPSSIGLALSMVYNGAKGETKDAIEKTLQFKNLDISSVNQQSLALINLLKNPDPKVELAIANSVWARKGIEFRQDFLTAAAKYYNAEISALDFKDPSAVGKINSWVSKNTKGKIPKIVENIPDEMVMYLINAVYFKGSWTTEFDRKLTQDRLFTTANGASKKHPLMRQTHLLPYLETETFQSVNLPYGENKRLSMYVFLPKNLETFIRGFDIKAWNEWMKQYENIEGTILLPRFKIEYAKELNLLLAKLGMGVAFQDNADLRGISDQHRLNISEVLHKSYVDVNEEGTEAAAATSVGAGVTSVRPRPKTFYMEVNRPFFFAIRDNQDQEILFMGAVNNP